MTDEMLVKIINKVDQLYERSSVKWISELNNCIKRQNFIEKRRENIRKELMDLLTKFKKAEKKLMDESAELEKECLHDFKKYYGYEHAYEECSICGLIK